MKDNQKIGLMIAAKRLGKGMTQNQLATMLGVSHQAVSKWESGQALPDIATMLDLTRIFGMTIEELIEEEHAPVEPAQETEAKETDAQEVNSMNINELIQMAPYMSKEAVGEIAMKIEGTIAAWQLAKLAPFMKQDVLEALIEKHHPELTWDALRRLAPFMSREMVDRLAREISEGKRSVHPTQDEINKAFDDVGKTFDEIGKGIGKAFDDIGKGVGETVQKVIRFGGSVINDVSEAINDLANDIQAEAQNAKHRSERAAQLRKRAFERALQDGKFEWIGEHIEEIREDNELMARIVTAAREREMHDWLCKYTDGYADEFSARTALENGDWGFLGDNVWKFEPEMQETIARAASEAENWEWLSKYIDQMDLGSAAPDIAGKAMKAGAKILAQQICEEHMDQASVDALVQETAASCDFDGLRLIIAGASETVCADVLLQLADSGEWEAVLACLASASDELKEQLLEKAVDAGNFDAIDAIDSSL